MTWTQIFVIFAGLAQIAKGVYSGDPTLTGSGVLTITALWTKSPKPVVDGEA